MAELPSGTEKDTGDKVFEKRSGDYLINADAGNVEVDPQKAKNVRKPVDADYGKVLDFQTIAEQVRKSAISYDMVARGFVSFTKLLLLYGGKCVTEEIGSNTVRRTVGRTVITLSALYVGYKLLRPVVEAVVKKFLGGERDDQKVKPGSLHEQLPCSTDERFLEVLIENKAEVNEKKKAIKKRSRVKWNTCEDDKNAAMDDTERNLKQNMISEARSLGLRFMSENPSCIRAIPYKSEDAKSLTMCLYMDTNGKRIPRKINIAAKKMFENYEIEFVDLLRRPLNKIVTQPSQRKNSNKLDEISRKIEKNLHLFENRLNVTAVRASYKVTDSIEQNIPCVRVYVLSKGKIPAGETDINEIKEENGDLFNETEFDVAEGYYRMTTGPSLKDYAWPLQGGVGIGVKGVNSAGTLGGFLEDEEGNVYILSNEHILHPPDAVQEDIVQPSKLDHEYTYSESERELNRLTGKINRIRAMNNEEFHSVLQETERDAEDARNRLHRIESKRPRRIGKYVCGVKDNHTVGDINVYVDAAIAKLDERELSAMTKYKNRKVEATRCPLYGFETEDYWNPMDDDYHPPNGEIIDFQTFKAHALTEQELQKRTGKPSKPRFLKIGKSTESTKEGYFEIAKEQIHLNIIGSENVPGLLHVPHPYCETCIQLEHPNYQPIPEKKELNVNRCKRCEQEFENPGQVRSFWAKNCYLVENRTEPFSKEGDSGALVFDREGRAWGLAFGVFDDLSRHRPSLISPLCVALDALKQKSGKKELKLWCTPNEEPTHEMQHSPASP